MSSLVQEVVDLVEYKGMDKYLMGINEKGEEIRVPLKDIYYFEHIERKSFAYLEKDVYQVRESLATLEEKLNNYGFVRINKSNIINLDFIIAIKPEVNMRIKAVMENDEYLVINRSYKANFKKRLLERRQML